MKLNLNHLAFPFILILLAFACAPKVDYPVLVEDTAHLRDSTMAPFYHGVASGDPLQDRVIIWTRVTPMDSLPSIKVAWEVASDETFSEIVNSGSQETDPSKDYTVKVDVDGLEEGARYFYRFKTLGKTSMTGKTKTAAQDLQSVSFGVVSCSNYDFGYFNSYGALAKEELDAVIHLGDYIYEYPPGYYGDSTAERTLIPEREIVTLQDYRSRYSQYRLDKDLIAAHASHPFINIWDDHEITNDSYKDGAKNHQPEEEGSYEERKQVARQAYYEWLPIRDGDKHFRKFKFGAMADLIMLDERLEGRTQQVDSLEDPTLMDSSRTMLGMEQRAWFIDQLKSSQAKWKVIGNQVIFSYLNYGRPTFKINLDSWDGYPVERTLISNTIKETPIENVVFITGDTHSSWAFEVTDNPFENYDQATGEGAYAVEFGTTSISSGNSNEYAPDSLVRLHEKKIINTNINPHLKYGNMRDHGYLVLELTQEKATATFKFLETIQEVGNYKIKEVNTYFVNDGEVKLRQ